jgi:hypothetical protein
MTENEGKKNVANRRAARLEAELRANLKKRKEQAKARTRASVTDGASTAAEEPQAPDDTVE